MKKTYKLRHLLNADNRPFTLLECILIINMVNLHTAIYNYELLASKVERSADWVRKTLNKLTKNGWLIKEKNEGKYMIRENRSIFFPSEKLILFLNEIKQKNSVSIQNYSASIQKNSEKHIGKTDICDDINYNNKLYIEKERKKEKRKKDQPTQKTEKASFSSSLFFDNLCKNDEEFKEELQTHLDNREQNGQRVDREYLNTLQANINEIVLEQELTPKQILRYANEKGWQQVKPNYYKSIAIQRARIDEEAAAVSLGVEFVMGSDYHTNVPKIVSDVINSFGGWRQMRETQNDYDNKSREDEFNARVKQTARRMLLKYKGGLNDGMVLLECEVAKILKKKKQYTVTLDIDSEFLIRVEDSEQGVVYGIA